MTIVDEFVEPADGEGREEECFSLIKEKAREYAEGKVTTWEAAERACRALAEEGGIPWEVAEKIILDAREAARDLAIAEACAISGVSLGTRIVVAEPPPEPEREPESWELGEPTVPAAKSKHEGAKSKREAPKAEKLAESEALSASSLEGKEAEIALEAMNAKHAVIEDYGGRCLVTSMRPSPIDPEQTELTLVTFEEFAKRYHNQYVDLGTRRREKLGPWWLEHPERRQYAGLRLEPGGPEELIVEGQCYLNLWRGFGVVPAAGQWPLMQAHILEVLAAGDPGGADYILRWTAFAVQHPGELTEQALVFRGGKGTGKGTFGNAARKLFGAHGKRIHSDKHFTGDFNAHLRDCCLLLSDEAFFAGDKRAEAALKGLITEPTFMLESKGKDAIEWRNRLKIMMTANADWVVPTSHDERRYTIFDVSEARKDDTAYFKAINAEIEQGGLAAMLWDLRAMDLGEWHPRQGYKTAALQAQKKESLEPALVWLDLVLQDGFLPGAVRTNPNPTCAVGGRFLRFCISRCESNQGVGRREVGI